MALNGLKKVGKKIINKSPIGLIYKGITGENIFQSNNNGEYPIENIDYLQWAEEQQKKQWEREDQIRKEVQSREDNAIQRKIEDMQKAGINPNLAYSMSGAESGGGITEATGIETGLQEKEMQSIVDIFRAELDKETDISEGKKDRLTDIFKSITFSLLFKK